MLGQKEKLILQYLYQNRGSFVTSKELSKHLACSDRTVRTYIKSLISFIEQEKGLQIVSKQGHGYQLELENEADYLNIVSENHIQVGTENIDINDRHNFIINKLIFEQEEILFEDLMDQLYVSRSTLSSDFKKIRHELAHYDLKIESRANKGVYVSGAEHDKRHFIMDYFFSGYFLKNIHQYIGDDFFKLPISFEELTIIVLDECRSRYLKLSDFVIQNLIVHIALAIKRVNDGFKISQLNIDQLKFKSEILVATNILRRLEQVTGTDFPDEEINYIALHLISESIHAENSDSLDYISLRQDLLDATTEIDHSYGYQFSQDFTFIEGLLKHLEVLLERVRNKVRLDNPLLDDIQRQYKEAFLISRSLMSKMNYFKDFDLSDDEIAYVTLHLLAGIERFYQNNKLNTLVICATGYGSAQMLRMRLENELGRQINIVNLVGYYDLTDERLEGIDLIISTIDLSNLVFSVPVLTTSVFLKDDEVQMIKNQLAEIDCKHYRSSQNNTTMTDVKVFDDYFSKDYFMVCQEGDKETVLRQLITLLNTKGDDQYRLSMKELIARRESMSTVIFDQDIAVPHPIKAIDKQGKIGVAIIPTGIYWEEGFEAVKLVFLVSPSIYKNDGLAEMTRLLVSLTECTQTKEKLIACQDFESFKQIILDIK
ncbi:BglG family transcription antiterminator [Streptococcus porcinus]|uniref:BglG family transcription antiterminator n=2 Tax=Streptococcus porcinus TaxID=1340 RepID=A0A4V0H868_STRPO|nr:BglG family transcription antiterminator [Streptococcus porcinus]EGJ27505.1 PRD domain protein [Streptococcus porcinus str. Jelinkova 176]MBA2795386.1 BglG family transcription antiterminator [Streptococcus porcinus]SQG44779.1 transcriptional regulator [Streptococcus porcinus]VTT45062.1 transcriptional regulator [Streptococcus porcinus]